MFFVRHLTGHDERPVMLKTILIRNIVLGVLLVALLAVACQQESTEEVDLSPKPLIDHPTDELLDLSQAQTTEEVSSIDLGDSDTIWHVWPDGKASTDNGRLKVISSKSRVVVWRRVAWDAAEIDAAEITLSASGGGGNVKFKWAGPGEGFSEELSATRPISRNRSTHRFNLRNHPNWSGKIERIGVHFSARPGMDSTIESISALRSRFDEVKLATLAGKNWKVELDHSLRNAVLTTPTSSVPWEVSGSRHDELRFSFGLLDATSPTSTLRISYVDGSGRIGTAFETTLSNENLLGRNQWNDVRVDLRPLGAIQQLIFEAPKSESGVGFSGVAVWGNPTLRSRDWKRRRPNVVLISLDTLRRDRLSAYGYSTATSPAIDGWAAEKGVLFENAVAASPRTLPSHVSMFTGLDPLSHGVNHHAPAPLHLSTLAEKLRRAGYSTFSTAGGGLMSPQFGLAQGFDEFFTWSGWPGGFEEIEHELEHAVKVLNRVADDNFFLFFHTFEIHDPYQSRPPFSDRCYTGSEDPESRSYLFGALPRPRNTGDGFLLQHDLVKWKVGTSVDSAIPATKGDLELASCLYDSGIHFADQHVSKLLGQLEELGLLDDTLIVLTSDHGESLGEREGQFKHAYLVDENLMIPLVIDFPGQDYEGVSVSTQVATVDIVPTILDYLNIELDASLDGVSLLPLLNDPDSGSPHEAWSYAAYENRGVAVRIDNRVKYTYNNSVGSEEFGLEELYRLEESPGESRNLVVEEPGLVSRLRQRVVEHSASRIKGVVLTLRNDACLVLDGEIQLSGMLTHLKSFDSSARAVRLLSNRTAAFSVDRGGAIELVIERKNPLRLKISARECLERVDHAETVVSYELGILDSLTGHGLTNAGWEETEDPGHGYMASISVEPRAASNESGESDVTDTEVLEQLRALGYIR